MVTKADTKRIPDVPTPERLRWIAAKAHISALKTGDSISTNIPRFHDIDVAEICALLTKDMRRQYKFEGSTLTRINNLPHRRNTKYDVSHLMPGESRVFDAPFTTWPAVRAAVREIAEAEGMLFTSNGRAGALVITRVDGTDMQPGPRLPFEATLPGGSFDVPAGPATEDLRNIRVQAHYYGKKLGCRFSVQKRPDGGCKITRDGGPGLQMLPPTLPAAPPPKPQPKPSFDEEEF